MTTWTQRTAALRAQVERLNLRRPAGFDDLSDEFLAARHNGCGPDWLPARFRRALTSEFHRFEAAFLVHDAMFADSDGTVDGFDRANEWLLDSCRAIVRAEVRWIRFWKRLQLNAACLEIAGACQTFGFGGWRSNAKGAAA